MSFAFDTINRNRLIEILSTFLNKDECRIIQKLLSNTKLDIRMNGAETKYFNTNMGSPQGDGLSGCLYTIYFETALKEIR